MNEKAPAPRVPISWKVAALVILGYCLVTPGLMAVSGVEYDEIFRSADNAISAALIPLAAGAVYLVIVLAILRWDHVFSDPGRLPMNKLLWAPLIVMIVAALFRYVGAPGDIPFDLVAVIIGCGVLVGFTEETVFRGILLRSLRAGERPEVQIVLIVSLAFGLFHLTNLAVGSPPAAAVVQVIIATLSGFVLYFARRATGLLIAGMALHGFWDISTFLAGTEEGFTSTFGNIAQGLTFANLALAVFAFIWLYRKQRNLRLTESGSLEGA
ncbi:MAG: CPBP family intramembrane metalloprotease [Solirubrobacterales bacterium]|nr:CPBP family intramembrane metalloprotease [Solirubrobacterales bacterium]